MQRAMVGFDRDAEDDWFSWLDCGHTQHVRHQPPFIMREWVTTAQGRQSRLGRMLDCVRCDHAELPNRLMLEQRSRVFSERDLLAGEMTGGPSSAGIWHIVEVMHGQLHYQLIEQAVAARLVPGVPGVVPPGLSWQLQEAKARVSFQIARYRVLTST